MVTFFFCLFRFHPVLQTVKTRCQATVKNIDVVALITDVRSTSNINQSCLEEQPRGRRVLKKKMTIVFFSFSFLISLKLSHL